MCCRDAKVLAVTGSDPVGAVRAPCGLYAEQVRRLPCLAAVCNETQEEGLPFKN